MSWHNFSDVPNVSVKIGIVGSKEVGKTALASLLNGHLKSLGLSTDLVYEVARLSPLPLNRATTIDSAYWIFGSQIAAESLVRSTRQFAICDRTALDTYPFAVCALGDDPDNRNLDSVKALLPLKKLIQNYVSARPYDYLFYVPIQQNASSIHLSSDPGFQSIIDREFRSFLSELGVGFHEVKAGNDYDRLREALNVIHREYDFVR